MHNDFNYTLKLKNGLSRLLGRPIEKLEFLAKGYRNSCYEIDFLGNEPDKTKTQKALLIIYKKESGILERIKQAGRFGKQLSSFGLPARVAVSPIIRISKQARYACLYNYLPGQTLPWEAYSRRHIKLLGSTMAEIHNLGKAPELESSAVEDFRDSLSRAFSYLERDDVRSALVKKLKLSIEVQYLEDSLPKLVNYLKRMQEYGLHLDLVRSNVLFSAGKNLTGILDFEKCGRGPRELDIARSLSFLFVDVKAKQTQDIAKYFLRSGYQKHSKKGRLNIKLVYMLVRYFLIYDFYKFLRHNPYEDLSSNEHFQRTLSYLIHLKLCANI